MAKLLISLPAGDVPHELEGEVITIGRTPDNKIQIDHSSVSAHHAKLFLINGIYKLKDMESTNRSYINGIPVSEAELVSSCFLRFGNIECVYKAEGANVSNQMQTHVTDLQKQMQDLSKPQEEAGQQSRMLLKEHDDAKHETAGFSTRLGEKQKQIESITLERAVLLQANRDLKTKFDIMATELAELKKRAERIPAMQNADQQVRELSAKLAETQRQVENLMRERAALLHSSQEMNARLEATNAQLNISRQKAGQLPAYTAAAQQKIDELTRERDGLKSKLEAAATEHPRPAQVSSVSQDQIDGLIRERDALLQANEALNARFEEATASGMQQEQNAAPVLKLEQPAELAPEPSLSVREMAALRVQQEMDESPVEDDYDDEPEVQPEPVAPMVTASAPRNVVTPAQAAGIATTPLLSSWLKRAAKRKTVTPQENSAEDSQKMYLNETLTIALPSAKPAVNATNGTALKPRTVAAAEVVEPQGTEVKQALDLLNGMRRTLHYFLRNQKDLKVLQELGRNANDLFAKAQAAELSSTCHLALALKTLLDDLSTNTHNINPSSLRTVGQSIDFFATLLDKQNLTRIHDVSEAKIFALDDDAGILETIAATMDLVKLKVTTCAEPVASLEQLAQDNYDMILLDVGLPGMNGLDVCTRVRSLPQHKNTPIVFLTGAATVQNRVQSTLSGGNDLIGKPFSVHELAVKVLTWIYKGQLGLT